MLTCSGGFFVRLLMHFKGEVHHLSDLRYEPQSIVLHFPHSSTHIPSSVRPGILLSDEELRQELVRVTDAFTDELFACGDERLTSVCHPVSRLVVDPERFEDDAREEMAQRGLGVVYAKTSNGRPLRQTPTPSQREALLEAFYRPHHGSLTHAVNTALAETGRAVIIDCHSFPSKPLPYELDQRSQRPDICVGTDAFHTPAELSQWLTIAFADAGYTVAVNRPFAGALVPSTFYRCNPNVHSVMVEVNRSLYMNETTGEKAYGFEDTKLALSKVLERLFV